MSRRFPELNEVFVHRLSPEQPPLRVRAIDVRNGEVYFVMTDSCAAEPWFPADPMAGRLLTLYPAFFHDEPGWMSVGVWPL